MNEILTIIESDKASELAYLQQLNKVLELTNQLHKARLEATDTVKSTMLDALMRSPSEDSESYTDTHTTAPYV